MSTTHPIEHGARARLIEEYTFEHAIGGPRTYPKGHEFEVTDYVSAEESEDGVAFYWGNTGGGFGNIAVPANLVEQAMSAEEMANRTPPSLATLTGLLHELCGQDGVGYTIDEVDGHGQPDGVAQVYGETDHGLRFGFTVTISNVHVTDL